MPKPVTKLEIGRGCQVCGGITGLRPVMEYGFHRNRRWKSRRVLCERCYEAARVMRCLRLDETLQPKALEYLTRLRARAEL